MSRKKQAISGLFQVLHEGFEATVSDILLRNSPWVKMRVPVSWFSFYSQDNPQVLHEQFADFILCF